VPRPTANAGPAPGQPPNPPLFLIDKQHRESQHKFKRLALYYILADGSIYQSPNIHAVVSSRQIACAHFVNKAFEALSGKFSGEEGGMTVPKRSLILKATEKNIQRARNNHEQVNSMLVKLQEVMVCCVSKSICFVSPNNCRNRHFSFLYLWFHSACRK
jgi:hypothetical protein